jgi:tetratricopeptide (TPR) repeat protein
MEYHPAKGLISASAQFSKEITYDGESFLEIHLDERFYIREDLELYFTSPAIDGNVCIDVAKRTFYNPDHCIDFISSYEWRKIFLTLNDTFTYILPLIHDLPQIVYIYIYSESPDRITLNKENYPKLRAIIDENSPNADDQLLEDIATFKRDLLPIKVINPIKRKTKLYTNDKSNHEDSSSDLSIIWIHDDDDKTMIDVSIIENNIKFVKKFINIDGCIDYIRSLNDNIQIFFISSKANNDFISSLIINQTKIHFIYIFQTEESIDTRLKDSSKKIRGIYLNIDDLFNRLFEDYNKYSKDFEMPISIFDKDKNEKSVRNLQEDNARFLWFQILTTILIKMPHNHKTIEEMLDECEKHEAKAPSIQSKKAIEDFREKYQSDEALQYYTAAKFLYRLFNRALRTENIDFLFVFRFFLADMYNQLQKLYIEQFLSDTTNLGRSLDVFRGQSMSITEFNIIKNNVGHLISINTFFSTTKDYAVARVFAGFDDAQKSFDQLSVVFQIEVDDTRHSLKRPFASLKEISKMTDEEEVLFSMGTIFRIEDVTEVPCSEKKWYVLLKLVNDDVNEMCDLQNELEIEFGSNYDLRSLGNILIKMGEYNKAERYFQMILEHLTEAEETTPYIYLFLGIINDNKGYYQKALEYQQQALKLYMERVIAFNHREDIGATYTHIGSSYHKLGNSQLALEYYTKAVEIQESPRKIAFTFNQIAIIHQENYDYQQALGYFQKALKIDEEVLKLNQYHPSLATAYNNIGDTYCRIGDYDAALKNLQHALKIRLKGTVSTHTDLAAIYHNLASVYVEINSFKEALEMYEKALEIDIQALPENHTSLAITHNNIGQIYLEQGDLHKALYHIETAISIMLKTNAKDNNLLSACRLNLASIYRSMRNYTDALNIATQVLENQKEFLPETHRLLATTNNTIGQIYQELGDLNKALYHAETAVRIMLKTNVKDNNSFATYQYNLAHIHLSLGNYQKALHMGNKALESQMEYSPKNHEKILKMYLLLSEVYKQQENISKATEYLEKYIEYARRSILPYDQDKFLTYQKKYDDLMSEYIMGNTNSSGGVYVASDQMLTNLNQQLEKTSLDDVFERINLLNQIGANLMQEMNFEAAIKVFNEAISLYSQHQESNVINGQPLRQLMVTVYFRSAKLYYGLKNWAIALQIFEKSLNLALKQDQQHSLLPEIYNALGLTYSHLQNYLKAKQHYRMAVDTAEKNLPNDDPNLQRYRLQLKQMQTVLTMTGIWHS